MEVSLFLLYTAASFAVWCALYVLLCRLQPHNSNEWNSRIIVIIHALTILIMSSVFGFFFNPWPFTHPGGESNKYEMSTLIVCNGYFVYDSLRGLLSGSKQSKAMVLHHIVCILFTSTSLLSGLSGTEIGLSLFFSELTNPMLQIRWLMRSAGRTEGILYEVNQVLFMMSFALIRVGVGSYWIFHYVQHPVPHVFFKIGGLMLHFVNIVFMGQILMVAYDRFFRHGKKKRRENLPAACDKTEM